MGERPADFDEDVIRKSPTFTKWLELANGEKLRYACRDFTKGKEEDEERLMRRIMIARRNNVRDHNMLKRAREDRLKSELNEQHKAMKLCPLKEIGDLQLRNEMDVISVEATRSYKAWLKIEDGKEFVYNQTYVKGKEGHDFLLKKNIWRRMRYRRENKMMVEKMRKDTERELSIRNSEDFSVVDDFMSNAMISNPVANMIVKGQKNEPCFSISKFKWPNVDPGCINGPGCCSCFFVSGKQ